MADITDLISYYINLLIIQYHNQPKAMATIGLFADEMLANGIMLDIQNAYDVDTAVGVQLDVIGKYVGVNRYYSSLNLANYFSLETYIELPPTTPPRYGFCTYATFDDPGGLGTLTYDDVITYQNALFDVDFRVLIKLKIIQNNINYSHQSIDDEIFAFFGNDLRPESSGNMVMVYFLMIQRSPLMDAIIKKRLLPKPMGVGMLIVEEIHEDMFALTDYTGYETPFGYGFSDYADYDTLPGQDLTYDQISAG